jgi:hypothetical protein
MAYKTLDKAARKNVIHPRNAARRKGRLMASLEAAKKRLHSKLCRTVRKTEPCGALFF